MTLKSNEMQDFREISSRVASVETRVTALEVQFVQFREEVGDEFSATREELRQEIRGGDEETRRQLSDEIRAGDEETRRQLRDEIRGGDEETRRLLRDEIRGGDEETRHLMRVLHEDVISRIALLDRG